MLITVRGRVEMDPTAIPCAASMQTGCDDTFAQVLQDTVATAAPARVDQRNPEPRAEEAATEEAPAEEPAPAAELPAEPPTDNSDEAAAAAAAFTPVAGPTTAPEDTTIRRGEPERQATAGKGADSPRTSSRTLEPLFAAVVQHTAQQTTPVVPVAGKQGVAAIDAARGAGTATRGSTLPAAPTSAALRGPATQGAFRTTNVANAELFEQARDSVFKQILVKLTGDGGEMRLALHPPELGELDLHLVVEDGNRLSLTIAAERQDMQHLLQRHLDELKHTLQQAGLEISGATVQTREEFAREHGGRFASGDHSGTAADGDDAAAANATTLPRRGGFISASGLDFWA